jgi:hypothetical protein
LIPGNSGQAAYLDFRAYNIKEELISGYYFKFNSSNRIWGISDSASKITEFKNIVPLSVSFGVFWDFLPVINRNDYSIQVGLLGTFRGIYGDAGSVYYNSFREKILDHRRVPFWGLEFPVTFKIKQLMAEVIPSFIFADSYPTPGLTGFQLRTNIRFRGGFPLLKEKGMED